ncbi:Transmembrane channel-like protein 5 [Acropora cervicornis]|uniref:Transmembrane channel-like protein 5 n=1 Tax=Acropora cervicornis TaxID=6130 RepID=A0AAD9R2R0_ACRCE|nr:Transmembrane channel-like protein 5 [Acropora cervicornis]
MMSDSTEDPGKATRIPSEFLDFSPATEANEEISPSVDEAGLVNENYVSSQSESNLLRVPSQESMASTETYHSNNSSVVHVRPQSGTNAGYEDEDEDDRSENDVDPWNADEDLSKKLPSHQFRSIRGLPSENAFKQGMRRTLKQRVNNSRGSIRSQSTDGSAGVGLHEDDVINDVPINLSPEEFAELTQRRKSIKEMPTSIRRKRSLRENMVDSAVHRRPAKRISAWRQLKLSIAMGWQHFIDGCKEILYSMELWRGDLKLIHGMFGSGVQSYFVLLRWLFLLNIVILVTTIFFLFIPQMIHNNSIQSNNNTFSGWEFLTGEGWFAPTELYYGVYTNEIIGSGDWKYNMPLAYLLVGGGYILLCLISLVFSMANSYRENYIYSGDQFSLFASKVFCSWDYGVTDKSAGLLKHKSVYNELKGENDVLEKLLLPLVVSGINLILPIATTVMMLVSVAMVTVMLFIDVQRCRSGGELLISTADRKCDKNIQGCWENYIGFSFYRLVIVDFVFLLLSTFFGEFVRRIVAVNIASCKETLGPPGFDISRNVIDLIYAQCLCWIGTFYSPLLPLIQLIKLLVLFYVKKTSVIMNCRPSMRPFRASKMNLVFLSLLALSFTLAMLTIGYTIMSEDVTSPSNLCGPFKGHASMYEIVSDLIQGFPKWLTDIIQYASSASVVTLVFCILGLIVYYYKMLKDSNEKKIKLLKEQISMAGRDKLYLIKKLKHGMSFPLDPITTD